MKTSTIKLFDLLRYKAYRVKYYRHFLFSHKPLCKKYEHESLRFFKNYYVCRSCFFMYTGLWAALALSLLNLNGRPGFYEIISTLIFAALITILTKPSIYHRFSRRIKDIIRFFDGVVISLVFVLFCKINLLVLIAGIIGFIFIKRIYNSQRDASKICSGCPELSTGRACSGYRKQVDALLNLEEKFSSTIQNRRNFVR